MNRKDKVYIAMIPFYLIALGYYKIVDGVKWLYSDMTKGEKTYVTLCLLGLVVAVAIMGYAVVQYLIEVFFS